MTILQENFGFERTPFSKDVSFKDLFRYPQLEDLFVRLRATAEDGSGLLVTGRAGTGKTTTIRGFLDTLGSTKNIVRIKQLTQVDFGNRRSPAAGPANTRGASIANKRRYGQTFTDVLGHDWSTLATQYADNGRSRSVESAAAIALRT